jgi:geranylgeranylglycerol-phosphate geranylgeranyltransferase
MSRLGAVLRLTRIEHSLMLVIAVIAAELMSGGIPLLPVFVLSLITPIFISMAAFAINDYFDVAVDKANKKNRPLVTGELTKCDALVVTYACVFIGIVASIPINAYAFVIASIFGTLALLYSYRLKERLFWGNAYIAFSMAIPFIYGSYVESGTIGYAIILVSAMIFISGLAREIHGTIRDLKGDTKVRNVMSFAKVFGVKGSAYLALALYAMAIAISLIIFAYVRPFQLNATYLLLILVTDVMLAWLGITHVYRKGSRFYSFSRNLSLAAMALALVTMLVAQLLPVHV